MALREGIDTVAFASFGVYSETYVSSDDGGDPIADLYASFGMLEAVPVFKVGRDRKWMGLYEFIKGG